MYGEARSKGLDPNYRYVSCYSSKVLTNWKFRGDVIKLSNPDTAILLSEKWVLERPKVFYNAKTKNMWCTCRWMAEWKGASPGAKPIVDYSYAKVGIAISDKSTGSFNYIKTFVHWEKKVVI